MERRGSIYSTRFERIFPEVAELVDKEPQGVFVIKLERFGGQLFGNINASGVKVGDTYRLQFDSVEPMALSSFFLAMAEQDGEVYPGGIYIINYRPKEECAWNMGRSENENPRGNFPNY